MKTAKEIVKTFKCKNCHSDGCSPAEYHDEQLVKAGMAEKDKEIKVLKKSDLRYKRCYAMSCKQIKHLDKLLDECQKTKKELNKLWHKRFEWLKDVLENCFWETTSDKFKDFVMGRVDEAQNKEFEDAI